MKLFTIIICALMLSCGLKTETKQPPKKSNSQPLFLNGASWRSTQCLANTTDLTHPRSMEIKVSFKSGTLIYEEWLYDDVNCETFFAAIQREADIEVFKTTPGGDNENYGLYELDERLDQYVLLASEKAAAYINLGRLCSVKLEKDVPRKVRGRCNFLKEGRSYNIMEVTNEGATEFLAFGKFTKQYDGTSRELRPRELDIDLKLSRRRK